MYLLDKLWKGDIAPSERYIRPGSEYKRKSKAFCDAAESVRLIVFIPRRIWKRTCA